MRSGLLNEGSYTEKRPNRVIIYGKLIFQIAMIIFSFVSLIFAISAYSSLESHHYAVKEYIRNWETLPLVDIKVSETSCPEGYKPILERKWPGTTYGCDCRYSTEYIQNLYKYSCSTNQTDSGCYDVYPTPSVPLTRMYNNILCGKRDGEDFVNSIRPVDGQCPEGYKLSHPGDKNKALCVKNDQQIPINDIKVLDRNSPTPEGFTELLLGDNFRIAYTTQSNNLPMVQFRLTEEGVCADKREYSKSRGRDLYILIDSSSYDYCSTKLGDVYTDSRFEKVGEILEKRLFDENGVTANIQKLPYYPLSDSNKYVWNLFQNSFYSWDLNCELQSGYSRELMVDLMNDALTVGSKQLSLMLICIFNTIVSSLMFGLLSIYFLIKDLKQEYEAGCYRLVHAIVAPLVKWGFFAAKVAFYIICLRVISQYHDSIAEMNDAQCADQMATIYLKNFGNNLLNTKSKNINGLVTTSISIVLSFLMLMLTCISYTIKLVRSK
ncbi:unnamed protein product [Moneuplotes crassus]|uniref:Uncharacterized protein n=1 Tax=Euplotes crassus TaxID=5936 RepID=A0AAD1ULQ0_EUPCR|nr:unnamed protein product [Moneuplotes crassus]